MRCILLGFITAVGLASTAHAFSLKETAQAVIEKIDDKLTYQVTDTPKLKEIPWNLNVARRVNRGLWAICTITSLEKLRAGKGDSLVHWLNIGARSALTYQSDKLINSLTTGQLPTKMLIVPGLGRDSYGLLRYTPSKDMLSEALKAGVVRLGQYHFFNHLEPVMANEQHHSWGAMLYQYIITPGLLLKAGYDIAPYLWSACTAQNTSPFSKLASISQLAIPFLHGITTWYIRYEVDKLASAPSASKPA